MELKELIERIDLLEGKNDSEENVKNHITVWMLKQLRYDDRTFDYEHALCRTTKNDKHADIFIPIDNGGAMFVETKKYTKTLNKDDIFQLLTYISLHNEIAWGILTNGRQIYLLNNSIHIYGNDPKNYMNKVVLNVEC